MEELILLINKNKKEIISYFESNNIKYKLDKNTITYELNMFDNKFKVEIRLFHKTAIGIRIYCSSLQTTNYEKFLNLINDTKNKVNSIYGAPDIDNTNHLAETVSISYNKDNTMIYIQGNNGLYNNNKYTFEIHIHSFNSKIKEKIWPRLLLYLAGGLFWGLMMFFTMAYGEYNQKNFAICMIGGLMVAILFGVIFELVMKFENRDKFTKINHKYDEKFSGYEKTIEYTLCLNGIMYPKIYPARVYFNGDNVIIVYYKRGLKIIETDIKYIDDNTNNCISFRIGQEKNSTILNLEDMNDQVKIIEYIRTTLYNNEKYNFIYNIVDKVIKEYNPYSLLNKNVNAFEYEIFYISKGIYNHSNINIDIIKDLIYENFDEDVDRVMLSDISELIIKELDNM